MELILESGRAEKNYWRDLWRYRELFIILARRDIAVRYKQTVIGVVWAVIRPFLTTISGATWFKAGDLSLPFIIYTLNDIPEPVFVFYCLWNDRANAQGRGTLSLTFGNHLTPVLQGLRNPGQRSLEIALTGDLDATQAKAILQNQLGKLIRNEMGGPAAETK